MEKCVRRTVRATLLVFLFTLTSARAATVLWTNAAGGFWSAASNWSPNTVPGVADAVIITNAGTYTITNSAAVTVSSIVMGYDTGTNAPVSFPRLRHTAGILTVTNLSVAPNAILTMTSPLTIASALSGGGSIDQLSSTLQLLGTGTIGTYSLASGEQRGGLLTVTNFNWSGGNLNADAPGDRVTVVSGGVLNYTGNAERYLSYYVLPGRRLDNFGTWNWSGAGSLRGQGGAVVNNLGVVNVTTNSQFNWGGAGAAPVWNNFGTFNRSVGTDFFYFNNVYLTNFGGIYNGGGSLSIYNSVFSNGGLISVSGSQLQFWASTGTNTAAISVGAGTLFTVENGSSVGFGPAASLSVPGYNNARFISGSVFLGTTNISTPSVWVSGAGLYFQTNNLIPTVNMSLGGIQMDVAITLAQLNQTNGNVQGRTLTVTNWNWYDGYHFRGTPGINNQDDRTIIPAGGVMNLLGTASHYFSYYSGNGPSRTLDNFGTINWLGNALFYSYGTVNNYGNVTVSAAGTPQYLAVNGNLPPTWNNYGTFTRSAGTVFYFQGAYVNNSGLLDVQQGNLSIYGSTFTNNGVINIAASSQFLSENSSSVTFTPASQITAPTLNSIRLGGASVYLQSTNVTSPSIWLQAGTLYQQTNIVIAQLNMSGGALEMTVPGTLAQLNQTNGNVQGRNLTVTNWNWYDGYHARGTPGINNQDDRTIIPTGGVMNLLGTANHLLTYYSGNGPSRTLDNFGTINWLGNALLQSYGTVNNYGNVIVSAVGTPQYIVVNGNLPPTWNNYGTFTRSAGTVFYFQGAYVNNSGLLAVQQGSLSIYGSTFTNNGTINVAANSQFLSENGSAVTFSPVSQITAPTLNSIRLGGASAYLQSTNIQSPSIWQQAGTLYQQTNIVIAQLNMSGGALEMTVPGTLAQLNQTNGHVQGRNLTVTNWNWYDGYHFRGTPGINNQDDRTIIPVGGVMNLLGTASHYFSYYSGNGPSRTLDNFGTINWLGNALFYSYGLVNNYGNVTVSAAGTPQYLAANGNLPPTWNNIGTFTRNAGTVFYFQGAYVNNSGLLDVQQGGLSIYGSTFTNSGVVNIAVGSQFLSESSGSVTFLPAGRVTAPTYDSIRLGGAAAYLQSTNIQSPSIWQQAGTLYQQTNIVIAALNMSGGALQLDVPATLAQLNQTNGHVQGRNLTVTNWNWYDGYHIRGTASVNNQDDRTIIPSGGTMNLLGVATHYLTYLVGSGPSRTVDNFGTVNWPGNAVLASYGQFNNYGSVNVTASGTAQYYNPNGNVPSVWNNYGTFTRSAGSLFYFQNGYVNNAGLISAQSGTLSIYAATFTNTTGNVDVGTNAVFQSEVGSVIALNGPSRIGALAADSIRLGGASAIIETTNIVSPTIWLQAGTVYQRTNIAVATINESGGALQLEVPATLAQLNQTNGDVQGRTITITNWNWMAGNHFRGTTSFNTNDDRTIIPAGGVMNLLGTTARALSYYVGSGPSRTLDNFGTVNWSGAAVLSSYGQFNNYGSVNVTAGGTAQYYNPNGNVPSVWNNYGTFTRAGSLFYFQNGYVNNSGLINLQQGTLSFYTATLTNLAGGTLQANSGAIIANDVSSETYLLPGSFLNAGSPNAYQVNSGNVHLRTTGLSLPSLLIAGGTLHQETNQVPAAINQSGGVWRLHLPTIVDTYNLTNGELRGANLTINNFNWQGGSLNSENAGSNTVTIPVGGTLAISTATAKGLSDYSGGNGRRLINQGSGTWSGSGITVSHGGRLINQGSLTQTGDVGLGNGGGTGIPALENQGGSFTKTNSAGVSTFSGVAVTNSGTINIASGGFSVGGSFVQTAGSSYLGTNFALSSEARIGAGTFTGRGNIAGTAYNNGVFNPGASPGVVAGTSFTNSAASAINFELGGLIGGTNHDQIRLSGTAVLDGTANVSLVNNFAPQLSNRFTIITCASRTGTFANVNPPPGVTLNTIYSPTNVILEVIGLTNAPLMITSFPSNQTIWTPDPVTFSVGVSGSTPISYQWQRFSTNLPNATNSSITIPAVTVADAGTYTLLVTDTYGGSTNASATLTVIPFAGTIYWTNVAGGDWSVASNWEPKRVPNATNTAMILSNGTYTVSINSPAAVSNLVVGFSSNLGTQTVHIVSGSSLALGGNSTFNTNTVLALNGTLQTAGGSNYIGGRLDWQLGTLSGAGRTVIATNAALTFYGSLNQKFIATNVLENYGTFTYGNDSFGNAQGLRFSGGAQLTNHPSGVISIGTAAYDYSGAQTPRSYLVNRGTINANSSGVFSPTYLSIDFINYGTLQDNGYCYISRGANYGTFSYGNTLCEVSVFGDESTGEYFSFEDGTTFVGTYPSLAVGGYAQWNTTAVHPGRVTVLSGSGGASFADPEFRVLKNYTQTGETVVRKGRWTQANPALTADLNAMYDGIVNGFHYFTISNAGKIYVNNLSHAIRNLANGGTIVVRSNLTLSGGATYATGKIVMTNGATGTFSGGSVDAQLIENYGTNTVNGGLSFTGNTFYRNRPGARTYFGGGSFVTGTAGMLNEALVDGFGGVTINFTNRGTVLANDSLNRNLALGVYIQESGLTEASPGSLSGTLDILAGTLVGTNSISGSLRNAGLFTPGKPFGLLSITGNYTNQPAGLETVVINGAKAITNFPQVQVSGTSYLSGTLSVTFTNGFLPVPGNLFTVMVFSARSGVFDSIINPDYQLEAFYTATNLVLRAENLLPVVNLAVTGGNTQYVCHPFKLTATASDPDGVVTNLVMYANGTAVAAGPNGGALNPSVESDFPAPVVFTARAIDERGGIRWATQTAQLVTYPLHTLMLGGLRSNNSAFKVCMLGQAGSNYLMQFSTNLGTTNWANLGPMQRTNGIWRYFDTNVTRGQSYYRALRQ